MFCSIVVHKSVGASSSREKLTSNKKRGRNLILKVLTIIALNFFQSAYAEMMDHRHHNMTIENSGLVMNSNDSTLPQECDKINGDYKIKVYAGTKYAADYPGTVFGMSEHEYQVEPCSRITVTFVNEDKVRHQWMVHGLPRYIYPGGMFHIEAAGGQSQTGTFIVPGDDRTYLVHCDMAQHMEKGMKAQLKVGKGNGNLWAVPGVSAGFFQDNYLSEETGTYLLIIAFVGLLATTLFYNRRQ